MDAIQFAKNWRVLQDELVDGVMDHNGRTEASRRVEAMALTTDQVAQLRGLLDVVLRDTLYTLLLGLDGCASIGPDQQVYRIHDEDGNLLSQSGQLEAAAWEVFHGEA